MNYYLDVWHEYFDFSGRARRKEYWFFTLYHGLIILIGEALAVTSYRENSALDRIFWSVLVLYVLASIIPAIAVTVRRLHDINKSGWWYFISMVPVVGGIWLLILMCTDGTNGPNTYGPDPKALDATAA